MKVPLLDLKAHHQPLQDELLAALERVLRSQRFILGPEVEALEARIADYSQTKFAVGVSSGTDALLIALMALDIRPGDEVITSPFSFFATAGVVSRLGARPVFVDIDPVTFNIDPKRIENAVTSKTKAIVPVHLFGQCADMDQVLALARDKNIPVIEDAAQAIGADYREGRRAGRLGQMGCFSFFPSKNLGCLGDAGMVVTNNAELAERLKILRVHGAKPKYYYKLVGGNFRLDAIQAAVLNVKLPHLDSWTRQRQENAQGYHDTFEKTQLLTKEQIRLPVAVYRDGKTPHYHIYNQFVIRARDRDRLKLFLKDREIDSEIYYPIPFHLQECFRDLGHKQGDFPFSEAAAKESLALPVYPEISEAQQKHVVATVEEFYCR